MQIIKTIDGLREATAAWRLEGQRIAFVPTMGNLHAGHLKLVEAAKASADRTVVSIFVNPTQFGQGEDYETYPRTEHEDAIKLNAAGVDVVFMPSVSEMYPNDAKTVVSVKDLSDLHCGKSRPGHFNGVATVVCKLLNMVQPDLAYFGQKDFQQLAVIKTMVRDLNIPVTIQSVETSRENSGLAMSSRNGYLSQQEYSIAPKLYQALFLARDKVALSREPYRDIEGKAVELLQSVGFHVDYFSICRSGDLLPAEVRDRELVILAAARLGKTRLIDNVTLTLPRT